ncbi:MAG TPA: tRNA (guanosine(46)-N7)-methyltransferase TrmB, partial [Roseateles sp.]
MEELDNNKPPQEPPQDLPRRAIKSFVTRAGRMGTGQIKALAELGPKFVLPYKAERIDPEAVFGRKAPLVLE